MTFLKVRLPLLCLPLLFLLLVFLLPSISSILATVVPSTGPGTVGIEERNSKDELSNAHRYDVVDGSGELCGHVRRITSGIQKEVCRL